jgi:outer membrane protein assembly factor BamB
MDMRFAHSVCCCVAVWLLGAAVAEAQSTYWPQFRGPGARGVTENTGLPDTWSATDNVVWKTDIPGRGWSSPIVWRDRVIVTTVVSSDTEEEPRKGLYLGGNRPAPPAGVHQWKVVCLDLTTGQILWERQVHEGQPATPRHLKNSYASETPVTDGKRVYCLFGNVGVFCLDFDGNEVWRYEIAPHAMRDGWGTAASPALHENRLYIVNDNQEDSYLVALDAESGAKVWQVPRDEKSNWSTPLVWQNELRTEIVTLGSGLVRSYDLDGQLLWWLKGMSGITIATPYADSGLLYFSSGFVADRLRPVYAVRPGASGDISLEDDQTANEWTVWCQKKAGPYNPSTLVYQGKLYVLYDNGTMACFDARDGSPVYDRQRIGSGGAFTASPWAYDGKIFCLNEEGETFVLKAGSQVELLRSNALDQDDMCLATPAIAGQRLLIRTAARVYCVGRAP